MRHARTVLTEARRAYTVRAAGLRLPSPPNLLDFLWAGLERNSGGGTAVHCLESGRKIGYERLRKASQNFAGWLTQNCPGSLALLLPNSPESIVSSLAALEAGVPLAAFNPESTPSELARSLQQVRSPWIITKSSLVHNALEAVKTVEAETKQDYPIKVISIDDDMVFSGVVQLIDIIDSTHQHHSITKSGTALVSNAWREHGPETVLTSSESLLAGCLQCTSSHLHPGARLATNLPFFTRYGLSQGVLTALSAGAEVVIIPNKGDFDKILHKHQPTVASLIPSSLDSMTAPPPTNLRLVTVPGLLGQCYSQTLHPTFKECLVQHYGPPEGPVVFCESRAQDSSRLGQPVAGTEVKVVAGGGEVGVMSEGEISVRGPQFGSEDGWVSTGDTGYYDPEGTFYLTRAGGIMVDGLAVWPAELEAVLQKHEGVVAASVFSTGSSLMAVVVPSDPYHPPEDLRLWMASHTAPHKQLTDIVFTASLPTTDSGHIDKALLVSRFMQSREYAAVSSV